MGVYSLAWNSKSIEMVKYFLLQVIYLKFICYRVWSEIWNAGVINNKLRAYFLLDYFKSNFFVSLHS